MIVCHCNVIDSSHIEQAIVEVHERTPAADVTLEQVFSQCGAKPDCGSCAEMITAMIEEIMAELGEKA